jgi:hypothetical protein
VEMAGLLAWEREPPRILIGHSLGGAAVSRACSSSRRRPRPGIPTQAGTCGAASRGRRHGPSARPAERSCASPGTRDSAEPTRRAGRGRPPSACRAWTTISWRRSRRTSGRCFTRDEDERARATARARPGGRWQPPPTSRGPRRAACRPLPRGGLSDANRPSGLSLGGVSVHRSGWAWMTPEVGRSEPDVRLSDTTPRTVMTRKPFQNRWLGLAPPNRPTSAHWLRPCSSMPCPLHVRVGRPGEGR